MVDFKKMLAEKKAKAALEAQQAASATVEVRVPTEVARVVEAAPEKAVEALQQAVKEVASVSPLDLAAPANNSTAKEVELKPEAAVQAAQNTANLKPLSFAEKMALKKAQIAGAQATPQAPEPKKAVIDPAMIPEDPVDAQAYVDIKQRIETLEGLFEDDLKSAMSELKAALKKNPNAAELMLDTDVGKMVMALRKITHTAQVQAEEGAKKTKGKAAKAKDVVLTKEQLEAAFNDL